MKFFTALFCLASLFTISLTGCGEPQNTVIVAPEQSEAELNAQREAEAAAQEAAMQTQ